MIASGLCGYHKATRSVWVLPAVLCPATKAVERHGRNPIDSFVEVRCVGSASSLRPGRSALSGKLQQAGRLNERVLALLP